MKPTRMKAKRSSESTAQTSRLELLFLLITLLTAVHVSAQPIAHHFTGITTAPDKAITLSLDGSVSGMFNLTGTISNQFRQMFDLYLVEASANLKDWTNVAVLQRANNDATSLLFRDTNAAGINQRFYRTFTNHSITAFPKPSGPFAVGTVDRVMIDPTRTNMYRYSPPTNAFMVTFWYPADPPAAGLIPAAMWDRRLASDPTVYSDSAAIAAGHKDAYGPSLGSAMDGRDAIIVPNLVGYRFAGVPVASSPDKFPVVLFSMHVNMWRKFHSQIGEELASHGYVVIIPEHADCRATEFPDGRYLAGNGSATVGSRLQDMRFILDELAVLNSGDSLFGGRLDLDRIGIAGTCHGGGTAAETCRSDSRVKCAAIYDGEVSVVNRAGLQKPLLVAVGQYNYYYSIDQTLFSTATNNAALLQIRGGNHVTAGDVWPWEILSGNGPARALDACLVWFFDTYLKGETRPFPTNPEIYNVQRK